MSSDDYLTGLNKNDLLNEIRDLKKRVRSLELKKVKFNRVDEVTNDLGLQTAGEFRSGNGVEPGGGFTGGRFGYPGFTYDGVEYFFVGVNNDVMMVGIDLATGKLVAGGKAVTLDNNGMALLHNDSVSEVVPKSILWKDGSGNVKAGIYEGSFDSIGASYVCLKLKSGTKFLMLSDASGLSANCNFAIYGNISANSFSTIPLGDTEAINGGYQPMNDDTAYSFTPNQSIGVVEFYGLGATGGVFGIVIYNTGVPTTQAMVIGTNTATATGALAGTTGTDGKFTVSCHTDGKIYFENRRGSTQYIRWNLFGGV